MISIFTPHWKGTNETIDRAYRSLLNQTYGKSVDWEWIILKNNGGVVLPSISDKRVKVIDGGESKTPKVGALKKEAIKHCTGCKLVELDADDELLPNCLEVLAGNDFDFAYSSTLEFLDDKPVLYGQAFGWERAKHELGEYNVCFDWGPEMLRRILWAPNHVRCWSRECYDKTGGYDDKLDICDDQDLLMRTYRHAKKIMKVPTPLYVQHVRSGKSGQLLKNADIQKRMVEVYERNYEDLWLAFCEDHAINDPAQVPLNALNLGAGGEERKGFLSVDLNRKADIQLNLNAPVWDIPENSCGLIRATNIIEHVQDPVVFMAQCWDKLVDGGLLVIAVPDAHGEGAYAPGHCNYFRPRWFRYFTEEFLSKWIDGPRPTFQEAFGPMVRQWYDGTISMIEWHGICLKEKKRRAGWCGFPDLKT